MPNREPPSVAILAARIMRAYPSLSPYSAASLATELESIERAQRTHATRQCNGGPREAKGDVPGYVKLVGLAGEDAGSFYPDPRAPRGMHWVHDPDAEQRAGERIERRVANWKCRVIDLTDPDRRYQRPADLHARILTRKAESIAIELQDDPRGRVLLLRLPGETEASSV